MRMTIEGLTSPSLSTKWPFLGRFDETGASSFGGRGADGFYMTEKTKGKTSNLQKRKLHASRYENVR
jgi:hypothetical protein